MENGTEGLFHQEHKRKSDVAPEVGNIYNRIEALPHEQRTQLILKVIKLLSVEELAEVLDEIATKLRSASS